MAHIFSPTATKASTNQVICKRLNEWGLKTRVSCPDQGQSILWSMCFPHNWAKTPNKTIHISSEWIWYIRSSKIKV